jgi:hypothetical protein
VVAMSKAAEIIEIKLTRVQFWILYLLAWYHYQTLLQRGEQDEDWLEILLCLQDAYEHDELHETIT